MVSKTYVDGVLVHWGEEILWERGPVMKKESKPLRVPAGDTPQRVRSHIAAMVRRAPQVMVKVTGGGADMKRIGAHMDYIARGGRYKDKGEEELALETDDGKLILGKEARDWLKRLWAQSGEPIPLEVADPPPSETVWQKRKRREALNVILSMPQGVDRQLVQAAARATAKKLFAENHLFAMVHHEDTDHQHTHIVVKIVGHDGVRMNPRKADLEEWRITFAKELNLRGVDAAATRRRVRLQRAKGERQAVRQMKARGERPIREDTAVTQDVPKMRAIANEKRITKAYTEIAKALATSPELDDQQLAKGLNGYLRQQGVNVPVRRQQGIR